MNVCLIKSKGIIMILNIVYHHVCMRFFSNLRRVNLRFGSDKKKRNEINVA